MKKKIRIGNKIFKIREVERDNIDVYGKINYSSDVILIDKSLGKWDKKQVLFHEIAHGLLKHMEGAEKGFLKRWKYSRLNKNEIFVDNLARSLFLTFKNEN